MDGLLHQKLTSIASTAGHDNPDDAKGPEETVEGDVEGWVQPVVSDVQLEQVVPTKQTPRHGQDCQNPNTHVNCLVNTVKISTLLALKTSKLYWF